MRKALSYCVVAGLLLCACMGKEKGSVKPTTFGVSVEEVHGTSVEFTIHPEDEQAWYAYTILNEYYEIAYNWDDKAVADNEFEVMRNSYEYYYQEQVNNTASFSDIFCYKGTRRFTEKFLVPDTDYRIVVFQLDPYKRAVTGGTCSEYLRTREVEYSDATFDIRFSGDTLRIIPSDASVTYFWDCNESIFVEEDFGGQDYYFRMLVYMYQEYNFMENLLHRGTLEWVFSRDDKSIKENDRRAVMVAGYADGEINTPLTTATFIYHRDGIEVEDDFGGEDDF